MEGLQLNLKDAIKEVVNVECKYKNQKMNYQSARERVISIIMTFSDYDRAVICSYMSCAELIV